MGLWCLVGVPAFGHMLGAVVGKIDEVSQEQEMENKFRSGPGGSAFTENTPEVSRYQTKKKKERKKKDATRNLYFKFWCEEIRSHSFLTLYILIFTSISSRTDAGRGRMTGWRRWRC